MGKSVADCYPGRPSGKRDWCEALAPVVDAFISDSNASNAWSEDIVFGMPFLSICSDSVVDERTWYGLNFCRSSLEYSSVAGQLAAIKKR